MGTKIKYIFLTINYSYQKGHENAQESDSIDEHAICERTKITELHNIIWLNGGFYGI